MLKFSHKISLDGHIFLKKRIYLRICHCASYKSKFMMRESLSLSLSLSHPHIHTLSLTLFFSLLGDLTSTIYSKEVTSPNNIYQTENK